MKDQSIFYGIIGLLAGVVITGFFATYAVNNNQSVMMGMMGMNRSRVMTGDMDRNFIEQMIPHHESAIAMAKLAQQKATHDEVKTMAGNIITSQTDEIKQMQQWYKEWYKTDVPKLDDKQMWGGSMMMNGQTSANMLNNASDFDKAFLEEMISHHQMAVMMANMLKTSTNHPEMQKLADNIIAAQTKEINDMKSWQQQWGYESSSSQSSDMMNMMGH